MLLSILSSPLFHLVAICRQTLKLFLSILFLKLLEIFYENPDEKFGDVSIFTHRFDPIFFFSLILMDLFKFYHFLFTSISCVLLFLPTQLCWSRFKSSEAASFPTNFIPLKEISFIFCLIVCWKKGVNRIFLCLGTEWL